MTIFGIVVAILIAYLVITNFYELLVIAWFIFMACAFVVALVALFSWLANL